MYDLLKISHFIGMTMIVGVSFVFFAIGLASKKWSDQDKAQFFEKSAVLGKLSSIGLALLILSGLGLWAVRGNVIFSMGGGWFHTKLLLVVILIGIYGFMQVKIKKARESKSSSALKSLANIRTVLGGLGIAIIVLAVKAFH